MSELFIGSIDLKKIDKTQIVNKDKNGVPFESGALYLPIAVWVNDEPDRYGNTLSISTGKKEGKIYLGNLKKYIKPTPSEGQTAGEGEIDDLPF